MSGFVDFENRPEPVIAAGSRRSVELSRQDRQSGYRKHSVAGASETVKHALFTGSASCENRARSCLSTTLRRAVERKGSAELPPPFEHAMSIAQPSAKRSFW